MGEKTQEIELTEDEIKDLKRAGQRVDGVNALLRKLADEALAADLAMAAAFDKVLKNYDIDAGKYKARHDRERSVVILTEKQWYEE